MTLNEIPETIVSEESTLENPAKLQIDKMFKEAIAQLQIGMKIGCKRCEFCKNGRGKGSRECVSAKNITLGFRDYFKEEHDITSKEEIMILDRVFHCSNLYKIKKLWSM